MTKKSDIPFGAQFSPNQVDLPSLLEIIQEHAGDRNRIIDAICGRFFASHSEEQRRKLAENTMLALRAYQLLDIDGERPTTLAQTLLQVADEPGELYRQFARHILLNLRGISFVETLDVMQTADEEITLHTLAKRLEQRGIHVPRGAVHLSSMRLWLAQAGIFDPKATGGPGLYAINSVRLQDLLGVGFGCD